MKVDPNEPAFPVTAEKFVDGVWKSCQRGGIPIRLHIATEIMGNMRSRIKSAELDSNSCALIALKDADALIAMYNDQPLAV